MDAPIRVQRKRTKGFKLPKNTKCVNSGTKWGNPCKVYKEGDMWRVLDICGKPVKAEFKDKKDAHFMAIGLYWKWLIINPNIELEDAVKDLKGKNLACFCPLDMPCHADYLLEISNK